MNLNQIEQATQAEIDSMNMLVEKGMDSFTFFEYKGLYDTIIACKQAQAIERIAKQLEDGETALLGLDDIRAILGKIQDRGLSVEMRS